MTYEQLLTTADQNGLLVKEKKLVQHDGLLSGRRIAIRKNIETQAEKSCVLAEEIGHHCTSSGDINKALQRLTMLTELSGISLPELLTEPVTKCV